MQGVAARWNTDSRGWRDSYENPTGLEHVGTKRRSSPVERPVVVGVTQQAQLHLRPADEFANDRAASSASQNSATFVCELGAITEMVASSVTLAIREQELADAYVTYNNSRLAAARKFLAVLTPLSRLRWRISASPSDAPLEEFRCDLSGGNSAL